MAQRHLSVIALGLLSLAALVGCQQPVSQSRYVAPSFDGPRLAAAPQPYAPPAPQPTFHTLPPSPPKAVRPPVVASNIPKSWIPPNTVRPWRWIVIHHSDTEVGGLAAIDKMHKAKGWDGVGYDFVIGNGTDTADGTVEPTFRWREQIIGAHAKTLDNRFNEYGIGICLVGNMMDHPPTAKQLAAVEKLTGYLMATYHIAPDHILGHGSTKPTDCPGRYTNLPLIRTAAARQAGVTAAYATSYARPTGEMLVQVSSAK